MNNNNVSQTRYRPRIISHVISIPFIALRSTILHFNCPSPHCSRAARNISFPANSYPLKRRKFHSCSF